MPSPGRATASTPPRAPRADDARDAAGGEARHTIAGRWPDARERPACAAHRPGRAWPPGLPEAASAPPAEQAGEPPPPLNPRKEGVARSRRAGARSRRATSRRSERGGWAGCGWPARRRTPAGSQRTDASSEVDASGSTGVVVSVHACELHAGVGAHVVDVRADACARRSAHARTGARRARARRERAERSGCPRGSALTLADVSLRVLRGPAPRPTATRRELRSNVPGLAQGLRGAYRPPRPASLGGSAHKIEQHPTVTTQARKCKSKGQGRCMVFDAPTGRPARTRRRGSSPATWSRRTSRTTSRTPRSCTDALAAGSRCGRCSSTGEGPESSSRQRWYCHRRRVRGGGGGGLGVRRRLVDHVVAHQLAGRRVELPLLRRGRRQRPG